MIIVKLYGGLGNQLFQFSTAYALAQTKNRPLYLDEKYYSKKNNIAHATPMLKHFSIQNKTLNIDNFVVIKNNKLTFLKTLLAKKNNKPVLLHIKEKNCNVENLNDFNFESLYLDGYWQSYQYFEQYRDQIIEQLTLKTQIPEQFLHFKNKIQSTTSVSLHVRRGDYLSKQNKKIYCSCPKSYYTDAINTIHSKVNSPQFFIFSDDVHFISEAFDWLPNKTIIDTGSTIYDFQLMCYCNHHITANSTFSWWPAWLNNSNHPIIITPKKWFLSSSLNEKDLIPNSWIKL